MQQGDYTTPYYHHTYPPIPTTDPHHPPFNHASAPPFTTTPSYHPPPPPPDHYPPLPNPNPNPQFDASQPPYQSQPPYNPPYDQSPYNNNNPTLFPTQSPTHSLSHIPTQFPTHLPSQDPTHFPSQVPNQFPSQVQSQVPSHSLSQAPSQFPSQSLSQFPSQVYETGYGGNYGGSVSDVGGADYYGKRTDMGNSRFESNGGGYDGYGGNGYGEGVYAYQGGKVEPYGSRGTGPKSSTWKEQVLFDDFGRPIGMQGKGKGKESGSGLAPKIVKAVPKAETREDVKGGVQKFRVKLLAESGGQSTMDVLCQIGLDGIRMLDPSTSRTLRIYSLDTITRCEKYDSSTLAFWSKSSVDIEPRRIRLQSNSYTTNTLLDTVTAATFQAKEMGGSSRPVDAVRVTEQSTEKKKGLGDWMNIIKPANEEKDHWVPDEAVTKCTGCGSDFSAFNRKHHCRNCGDIFCDKCTHGRTALTSEENAPQVRVCDRCMNFQLELPGFKYRHDLVRDVLWDVLRSAGVSAKKEAPVNFLTDPREGRSTLRPADVLVFGWVRGKHACVDLTGVSPLVGLRDSGFVPGQAVLRAEAKKVAKHEAACLENQHVFLPFAFDTFGSLAPEAVRFLKRVQKVEVTHRLSSAKEAAASRTSGLQSHEDLAKKLQELERNHKSSSGSRSGGSSRRMKEVACPTCTVHLQVQVPISGSETIECGVCQHPFLVNSR